MAIRGGIICFLAAFLVTACADLQQAKRASLRGDYTAAVAQWQELAAYDVPEAQVNLGMAYLKGQGVPRDPQRGIDLLSRAAESNDPKVMYEIGRLFEIGVPGVLKPDYKKAWEYLDRAYAMGQTRALVNMADMTDKGYGVPRNPKKAADMLKSASDAGVGSATHKLARQAMKAGKMAVAVPLFERAYAQGAENAGVTLAGIYLKNGQAQRAIDIYKDAVAAGATPNSILAKKMGID